MGSFTNRDIALVQLTNGQAMKRNFRFVEVAKLEGKTVESRPDDAQEFDRGFNKSLQLHGSQISNARAQHMQAHLKISEGVSNGYIAWTRLGCNTRKYARGR